MVTEISLRHQREVFSPHPDDPYLSVEIGTYYLTNQIRNQVARKFNPGSRMKYTYAYKTSDGVRHEESMNAASREEVFAELRKRGIKAMGEGMKNEARSYIAAGGTIVEYGKRLMERQDAEIAVYNRVKADLEKARSAMFDDAFMSYWEKRDDKLQ